MGHYDGEPVYTTEQAMHALNALDQFFRPHNQEFAETAALMASVLEIQNGEWSVDEMYGAKVTYYHRPGNSDYDTDKGEWVYDYDEDEVDLYGADDTPLVAHRALVFEAELNRKLSDEDEAYDPNTGEIVDPDVYPFGTVNVVYGVGTDQLGIDYNSDVEVATSVTPAENRENPQAYTYAPGWPDE